MDWTGRSLPLGEYGSNSEYSSTSGYESTAYDLPQQQTVSLKDLDLGRWRPTESYGYATSSSNELERLDTSTKPPHEQSLEQSGDMSPMTYTSDFVFGLSKSDTNMESDDTDDEPDLDSPMAYARFYGLRRDSPLDHPLSSDLILLPSEDIYLDMEEPSGLLRAEALQEEAWESLKNERLDVNRETATFLASLLGAARKFELDPVDVVLEPEGLHQLKLELPLLARDHEVEMLALRRRNEVRLCSKGIDPFQLDFEKGEGVAFPRAEIDKKLSLDRELANEKLDVDRETVELLRDLRELWSGKGVNLLDGLYESYKKGKAIHISPPLLPVTPPYSPFAPAIGAMQIELTSTPEDLIAKDAAAAEKEIVDKQQVEDVTSTDNPLFSKQEISAAIESFTAVPSSSSPLARKRSRSLYLEPPLTPYDHTELTSDDDGSSAKRFKKVHFDPGLVALLPGPQIESSDALPDVAEQQDVELQDLIIREAESVEQLLQNEHLIDIDTTLRVRVPQLDPVQLHPPWEPGGNTDVDETTLQTQRTMMRHFSEQNLKDTRRWSGITKLERILLWAPFPSHLAKVDLHEQFDGDACLVDFLADMGLDDGSGDIDVQLLIARKPRSHETDDEEIEPAVFEDDDLDNEMVEEERQEQEHPVRRSVKPNLLSPKRLQKLDPPATLVNQVLPAPSALPITTAFFGTSASTANVMQGDGLAHFMQLRGKAPRISKSVGQDLGRGTELPSALSALKSKLVPAVVMVPQVDNREEPETATIDIPIPEVKQFSTHHKFPIVTSSAFMAGNRRLLRLLQTVLANIDICEREAVITYPLGNSKGHTPPEEADLTISPSTGVILTTLQKIKQRPLPGQQTSPTGSLRARFASTAPLYERLIILVKENSSSSSDLSQPEDIMAPPITNPLDDLDCAALADLTAWTASTFPSGPEIQLLYIPGGDLETAKWLAAAISPHHCHPRPHHNQRNPNVDPSASENENDDNDDNPFLPNETMWERWLRAAGLNAFAAQAVLRSLRSSDLSSSESSAGGIRLASPRFGLQAFVDMTLEERVEIFKGVLGGEGVLRRVGEVLEGGWGGVS